MKKLEYWVTHSLDKVFPDIECPITTNLEKLIVVELCLKSTRGEFEVPAIAASVYNVNIGGAIVFEREERASC